MATRIGVFIRLAVCLPLIPVGTPGRQPCAGITSLAQCPPEGCGSGDPQLNKKKNRTDPNPPNIQARTLGQIRQFNEPSSWPSGKNRAYLAFREDRGIVVKGFLEGARKSGRESTNRRLTGEENNDFHLDFISSRGAPKATAVTAEITPRLRNPGWEFEKLDHLAEGQFYVRVTGWYLLDTMHIANPIVRSTNWEIHPITRLEVCTLTRAKCDQGMGWVLLKEWEIPE